MRYILEGLSNGFHIGHDTSQAIKSATSNMPSAAKNPESVQKYVDNELAEQRIIGPFTQAEAEGVQVSRF